MFTIEEESIRSLDESPVPDPVVVANGGDFRILLVVLGVLLGMLLVVLLGAGVLAFGSNQSPDGGGSVVETGSEPAQVAPPGSVAQPAPAVDNSSAWLRVDGFGSMDFGTSADQAIETVSQRFGEPNTQTVRGDCPAGVATLVNYNGFTLHMTDNEIVGWVYQSASSGLQTPSGIKPGTSLDVLTSTYSGVTISETSLGTEFYYETSSGYMAGFMSEDGQSVASLYAGETCFFR